MADTRLQPMRPAGVRKAGAEPVRGFGLADARDIVVLAFNRLQRDALDLAGIDRNAAMGHLALRQRVTDEHGLAGLQIELGGEVHYGEVFVVELAMLLRGVAIAFDEVQEKMAMC